MMRKSNSAYIRSRNVCVILDSIPNCGKGRNRAYQGHLSQLILVASLSAVVAVCTTVPVRQTSPRSQTGSPCLVLHIDLISGSALIADAVEAGEELGMWMRRRCPGEQAGLEPLLAQSQCRRRPLFLLLLLLLPSVPFLAGCPDGPSLELLPPAKEGID